MFIYIPTGDIFYIEIIDNVSRIDAGNNLKSIFCKLTTAEILDDSEFLDLANENN
jgi:hypothetical protein